MFRNYGQKILSLPYNLANFLVPNSSPNTPYTTRLGHTEFITFWNLLLFKCHCARASISGWNAPWFFYLVSSNWSDLIFSKLILLAMQRIEDRDEKGWQPREGRCKVLSIGLLVGGGWLITQLLQILLLQVGAPSSRLTQHSAHSSMISNT